MLFCFTWIPEPGQGVGNGLPQFPINAPGHSPLPALPAQGLSGFCSAPHRVGSVSVLSPGFYRCSLLGDPVSGCPGAPGAPGIWELGSATQFLIQYP